MKKQLLLYFLSLLSVNSFAQNIGINTTTPTKAKLQIVGVSNLSLLNVTTGDNQTGISISSPSGIASALNFNLYWGNVYRPLADGYGSNFVFNQSTGLLSYSTTQTSYTAGSLALFNSANFYLDSNGYLGLGTSIPKTRLHALSAVIGPSSITPAVGYALSVGGKVICEELKVQINSAWPDYVFEDSYNLPTLSQLEQKVMEQKHLPGILSSSEVKAQQGIELGDMQKRMLEKMEELYRYTFQLNKENIALKLRIENLEKSIPH